MPNRLNFLQASVPLTKSYTLKAGELIKTPYPMTWEFSSHEHVCDDLKTLCSLLVEHAKHGHCMIKGELKRPLVHESRAGMTDSQAPTQLLCLDLDGLPENIETTTPSGQIVTAPLTLELFLREMGLHDISYVVQWSASYGISDKRLRAHVFMFLDKPHAAPLLKQWLIQKNHSVPLLRGAMELTKTGNSIRWLLDISACQNDKLIYIAAPILKGIKDPMGKQSRIQYVKHKYDVLALDSAINSTERNKQLTQTRINELRDAAGLQTRKFAYKVVGGTEVMLKPDEAVITEMKVERGFVYFNLNGGDSWAYYHPEDRPEYIHNFKGEPTYLTKELLPSYWSQLTQQGAKSNSKGVLYLAFCDKKTGVYWRGTYDSVADDLDIYPAKTETQLRDFCAQHGVLVGDFISEWDLVFDPHDNVRVDVANRVVNRFKPSAFMKEAVKKTAKCPPTIYKVMHHALGGDAQITAHFINWLAFVLQHRDRSKTAWVLHGTQGTGKGILTNNILRPIFGTHTATRRMEELNEKYNHFMNDSLLVFVDEVQIKALGNERGIMAKLKNFITEEIVPIRAMHSNAVEARNYTNWIFMSNMPDPVMIDRGDRRFNVGRYQPEKLIVSDAELEKIAKELQAFHDFLMTHTCDVQQARQVIQSEDRDNMISVSEQAVDQVSNALMNGNFEFFVDQLPANQAHQRNALQINRIDEYTEVLKTVMLRTKPDGKCNISREELRTLYDYTVGNMPQSPNKFTSLLKHHRIHTKPVWVDNKTVHGLSVTWTDYDQFPAYTKAHFTSGKPALKLVAGKKEKA
jgi:hypothetical protein